MKLLDIDKDSKYLDKIHEIYFDSFPENERVSFENIVNREFPNSRLLGFVDKDKLVGFSYVSVSDEFVYIVYLAIDKEYRFQGYGTNALSEIDKMFKDKTKVLSVEKPEYPNDTPSKKIAFYKKSGYELNDFEFVWINQVYYSVHYGKYNKEKFLKLLLTLFPTCTDFKDIETSQF